MNFTWPFLYLQVEDADGKLDMIVWQIDSFEKEFKDPQNDVCMSFQSSVKTVDMSDCKESDNFASGSYCSSLNWNNSCPTKFFGYVYWQGVDNYSSHLIRKTQWQNSISVQATRYSSGEFPRYWMQQNDFRCRCLDCLNLWLKSRRSIRPFARTFTRCNSCRSNWRNPWGCSSIKFTATTTCCAARLWRKRNRVSWNARLDEIEQLFLIIHSEKLFSFQKQFTLINSLGIEKQNKIDLGNK